MEKSCNFSLFSKMFILLFLTSCGREPNDQCVWSGTKCKGLQGERGLPGDTGQQGNEGPAGRNGSTGPAGQPGTPGEKGDKGDKGDSCSATRFSNGVTISCEDGTTTAVLDGINGANGQDGEDGEDGQDAPPTAYSVIEMKDPCGDQSGFDEILLKTANGSWIAHFSSGNREFLTVLTPGNYVTTDQSQCYFTLNNDGTISGEHN